MIDPLAEERKAVIAAANGEPLPEGWWKLSGTEFLKIDEYEKHMTERREAERLAKEKKPRGKAKQKEDRLLDTGREDMEWTD